VSTRRLVAAVAVVVGILLIVVAAIYWAEPAKSLPSFFPGHSRHSPHHHVKRAIAALIVAAIFLVLAWVQARRDRPRASVAP
jgi:drug/metabolite transporter (DMT)-like permease